MTPAEIQSILHEQGGASIYVCPLCERPSMVRDSFRLHVDGSVRIYWECADCNASLMRRIR